MQIIFTANETELLLEILEEHQHELLREIAKAEHRDFRDVLRNKEKILESMVAKLKHQQDGEIISRSA